MKEGERRDGKYKSKKRKGENMWFRATYKHVFNSDGQRYKIVKFDTDVTADVMRNQREQEDAVNAWDMDVKKRGSAQNGANVIENVSL
ncbi:hypothetical protein [Leclercia adecarboxylata]|uniref:hypothetical protein n=1 Tax=Leclercia adecarboxylata TaxID=83655 RepID=UPI00234C5E57|nr:hypothetical protein [Leclercia adecarboxylata]MDC6700807.1 hypothetical protein [Leclercia adecarboxylata]